MRLKMLVIALAAFCLFAVPSFAGDITGTWVAEMSMPKMGGGPGGGPGGGGPGGAPSGPMKFTYNFKADGAKLTGTQIGPRGGEPNEILDGKIDGDKISFTIKVQGMGGNEMKINYTGTVKGDEIELKFAMEGGMGGPGGGGMEMPPMIAKRQK